MALIVWFALSYAQYVPLHGTKSVVAYFRELWLLTYSIAAYCYELLQHYLLHNYI